MTEAEWLTTTDPVPMVWLIRKRGTERRQRLAACACCRAAWDIIGDNRFECAIESGEQLADGELVEMADSAMLNPQNALPLDTLPLGIATLECANHNWTTSLSIVVPDEPTPLKKIGKAIGSWLSIGTQDCQEPKHPIWCHLIRDIFGNPFRPVNTDPTWLTPTVVSLATGIYAEKAFDRMPILADALQDAGCDNDDILNHCRQPGGHVRGCFVVDLVLGKK